MNTGFKTRYYFQRGVCLALASVLVGCATYDEAVESQKLAYKKAERRESGLEIPPDLTAQTPDEQFIIPQPGGSLPPGSSSDRVSASDYFAGQSRRQAISANLQEPVLVAPEDAEIRKIGSQRVIYVKRPPGQVYAALRGFWAQMGFDLPVDDPAVGMMETNWLENRAKIPLDGVRKVIGRFFDGLYSSNSKDKFRTRIEPTADGGTEVYITHRAMSEDFIDNTAENQLRWQPGQSDPELVAEMSNRFLVYLVGEENKALVARVDAGTGDVIPDVQAQVEGLQPGSLVLNAQFPVAWRRVGLALDRVGLIIEDRDRSAGTYFVRYNPDSAVRDKEDGFFGKLFGFVGSDGLGRDMSLRVSVQKMPDGRSQILFADGQGGALKPTALQEASDLLEKELRRQ